MDYGMTAWIETPTPDHLRTRHDAARAPIEANFSSHVHDPLISCELLFLICPME